MKYVSTRNKSIQYDFQRVLFEGFAPDGGLFVPKPLPEVPWRQWKGRSYPYIVGQLLKIFADDPELPVEKLVDRAYGQTIFDHPSIAPFKKLDDHPSLFVLELFHGPTWSFKDYALMLIGELLDYYLGKSDQRLCLLIATSGDTGSSAIEAVKNKSNIEIVVLFPEGRITRIQELQMTTVKAKNVHPIQVDANSDDLDAIIREIIADQNFVKKHCLGTINSINWARICIQMAHWFYAYLETTTMPDERLTIAVPVGACGNLTAGLYAQKMGLPINIIGCTNKNDVFHTFVATGSLRSGVAEKTLAVAMDIQVPYNIERILSLLDEEENLTKRIMEQFYATNSCQTPRETIIKIQQFIKTCSVSDEQILSTVKQTFEKFAYECCPHTATALYGATKFSDGNQICVCISTAAPYKFPEVFESVDLCPPTNDRLKHLLVQPVQPFPIWRKGDDFVKLLSEKIIRVTTAK